MVARRTPKLPPLPLANPFIFLFPAFRLARLALLALLAPRLLAVHHHLLRPCLRLRLLFHCHHHRFRF